MFGYSKKKKLRNKVIAAAMGVAVMTLGIWLNYSDNKDITTEETLNKVKIEESNVKESVSEDVDKEIEDEDETDTDIDDKTYFIIEEEGVVKVYLCDANNNRELYLITSIPYELLSEEDQALFNEGVTLSTEKDLGRFLENFDS